jgi:hypothetical protein
MTDRLTTPRMRVLMSDGTCHELQALNVDLVAWDRERGRHRDWPAAQDAPFLWATYLAWHVLQRSNLFTGPLPAFELDAQQVEILADDEDDDAVDPTRTGPEPG